VLQLWLGSSYLHLSLFKSLAEEGTLIIGDMKAKVGINGFGRIFIKTVLKNKKFLENFEIVAVNILYVQKL
jgi:NurA-like 5'-3' nuclease